ncbi:MAG: tetratricopeptide repeat protein [Treponema sp.]|jgi:tetratricopeptide (TPR) repeat protein|nr:tetratricopeptide repeat protein [Treponema sp.]
MRKKMFLKYIIFALCSFLIVICIGCVGMAASAEEYYSIGMAFFDLGKFEDAEKWLNRARQADRTYVASQYNLGRLAFERQRFDEAARHFEGILRRDPDNVLALRAAAYTRIRLGNIDIAQRHYSRLLQLVPESADDGYNHALVLFAMEFFAEAEEVLERYPVSLLENKDMQLLFARSQAAQNKVEAINTYANFLEHFPDPKARFEYAAVLEHHEFYVKALEEFHAALAELTPTTTDLSRHEVIFSIARVLLIADSESSEGITELQSIIDDGFNDITAVEKLAENTKISSANIERLRAMITNMRRMAVVVEEPQQETFIDDDDMENIDSTLETDPESSSY